MTEFLVKHFVKDYEHVEKVSVRTAYGVLASIVGIFCNVFLFVVKFAVGLVAHSVSVMADALNNLSDAGSSIISFVGVKMAEKPADEDHPFGHGRIEYIAALVVSFIVLEVGFTFFKDSLGKIRTPQEINFRMISRCDPVIVYRRQIMAWTVQPEAGRKDRFQGDESRVCRFYGRCAGDDVNGRVACFIFFDRDQCGRDRGESAWRLLSCGQESGSRKIRWSR